MSGRRRGGGGRGAEREIRGDAARGRRELPERLRPLNEPRPVRVRTDGGGRPAAVADPASRRRVRAVATVRESWRIDDEWWRRPVSRLYHDVVLENGQLLILYRDRIGGGWYVQG